MDTCENEFRDAVSLVQKLPKNGPYKPSDASRLKLYALYKQATMGPNLSQPPNFVWDPIGRYKWKTWKDLGDMSIREAMENYVKEFKELVTNIPNTTDSATFLSMYGSKFPSAQETTEIVETFQSMERSHECIEVMPQSKLESDNDEFCDTIDMRHAPQCTGTAFNSNLEHSNTEHSSDSTQDTLRRKRRKQTGKKTSESFGSSEGCSSDVRIIDVESQILRTLRLMRQDVQGLLKRMDTLENILAQHLLSEQSRHCISGQLWDRRWLIFVVTWPVLTQLLMMWYVKRNFRRR